MSNQHTFIRAYPAQVEQTGPRQLSGRLVPYDTPTQVLDEFPDGQVEIYAEGFRRGAFSPQVNSKNKGVVSKISLVHQHGLAGLGYLGPFIGLREEPDGLYGEVRILPTHETNVQALLEEGVNELSVEFRLPRGDHTVELDGVRWRTRAHLDQVALEAKGAYSEAQVLAYRAEVDELHREQDAERQEQDAERQAQEDAAATEAERERLRVEAEEARRKLLEAEAEESARRKQEFDELAARYDRDLEKQKQLVRDYGVTRPRG